MPGHTREAEEFRQGSYGNRDTQTVDIPHFNRSRGVLCEFCASFELLPRALRIDLSRGEIKAWP